MILPPVRHASCRRGAGNEGRSRKFERNASHGGSKFSRMRAPPPPAAIGMHGIPQEPARQPPSRAGSVFDSRQARDSNIPSRAATPSTDRGA